MALIKKFISESRYSIKSPYTMKPEGICVHNTANDATAKNEVSYMERNDNKVSFHVAIDDKESIQCIPFNRNAYAAGDGSGPGNRAHIHIEICYSKTGGEKFNNAEKRAAKEIASILKQYNWNISKVKTHKYFSGKDCPHRTMNIGWNRFLDMVSKELGNSSSPGPSESGDVKYRVVVNSYTQRENANKMVADLKAKGIESFLEAYIKDGVNFLRVIAGSYNSRANADSQLAKIKSLGFNCFIDIYKPASNIVVGTNVQVVPDAKQYATGELIPSFVKSKTYKVTSIKDNKALLSDIVSWVFIKDLRKV